MCATEARIFRSFPFSLSTSRRLSLLSFDPHASSGSMSLSLCSRESRYRKRALDSSLGRQRAIDGKFARFAHLLFSLSSGYRLPVWVCVFIAADPAVDRRASGVADRRTLCLHVLQFLPFASRWRAVSLSHPILASQLRLGLPMCLPDSLFRNQHPFSPIAIERTKETKAASQTHAKAQRFADAGTESTRHARLVRQRERERTGGEGSRAVMQERRWRL